MSSIIEQVHELKNQYAVYPRKPDFVANRGLRKVSGSEPTALEGWTNETYSNNVDQNYDREHNSRAERAVLWKETVQYLNGENDLNGMV